MKVLPFHFAHEQIFHVGDGGGRDAFRRDACGDGGNGGDAFRRDQPSGYPDRARSRDADLMALPREAAPRVLFDAPRSLPRPLLLFAWPLVLAPSFFAPAAPPAVSEQIFAAVGSPLMEIPIAAVLDGDCAKANCASENGCVVCANN